MTIPNILIDCTRYSRSGNLDLLLAEKYLEADDWGGAVRTIQKALKKIRTGADGKAFWILGHAYYKQGQIELARSAFEKAVGFERYRTKAQNWLNTVGQR